MNDDLVEVVAKAIRDELGLADMICAGRAAKAAIQAIEAYEGRVNDTDVVDIDELKTICAEAYHVVGCFMDYLPNEKILDNLSQQKLVHSDVLPFKPKRLPFQRRENSLFDQQPDDVSKLREALQGLVSLKEYRDKHGKNWEYNVRKPLAWTKARQALGKE